MEIACVDSTPFDGQWACLWNAGDLAGLDGIEIRARGTDSFGTVGAWTAWMALAVDTVPPTITVDAALETALADGYVSAAEARITGQVIDDQSARKARECTPGEGGPDCTLLSVRPGTAPTGTWSLEVSTEGADGITHTLTLYGYDQVGNRSAPLTRTFRVDAVAPVITVTTPMSGSDLLISRHHASGLVRDGGAVATIYVVIQMPNGDFSVESVELEGTTWTFDMPPSIPPGVYPIWIEAVDAAGNVGIVGPYNVVTPHPLSKQVTPESDVAPGSTVAYALTFYNPTDELITSVVLTDPLSHPALSGTLRQWGPFTVASQMTETFNFATAISNDPRYYGERVTNTAAFRAETPAGPIHGEAQATFTITTRPTFTPTIAVIRPLSGSVFTVDDGATAPVPIEIKTTGFTLPDDGTWTLWINGAQVIDQIQTPYITPTLSIGAQTLSATLYTTDAQLVAAASDVTVYVRASHYLYLPMILRES
jgi:hypothetical protein